MKERHEIPPEQEAMLREVEATVKRHGFPGGFLLFFQVDPTGKTAMGSLGLDAPAVVDVLESTAKEIREYFGVGVRRT